MIGIVWAGELRGVGQHYLRNYGSNAPDQTVGNVLRRHGIAPAPQRGRVTIAGITRHPDGGWMEQVARSATQEGWGYLNRCRYVLHDRDTKFCASFRSVLTEAGVKPIMLPAKSPNLKDYASYCTSCGRTGATLLREAA